MLSETYQGQTVKLKAWFVDRLHNHEPFTMKSADYLHGVDAAPADIKAMAQEAFQEWLTKHGYELSYNQVCQACFGALKELNLLTVPEA